MTWETFTESELHQNAVMRPLEIIGEAAAQVSQPTRQAPPEVPWAEMIGMRHRLIHEYFRVDLRVVWETVQRDLPQLIALIEPLVPPDNEEC
jgi:uncharacterized protein with HEPN domain